jgi:subtilisin family serine protease
MPLATTGVNQWRLAHPTFDGRGVLIAILDSGLDPGVAGLTRTTTGERKVLDLRDFSGEGDVALARVVAEASGRIALPGGLVLSGAEAVRRVASDTLWYGGVLDELPFGDAPAADFNRNGSNRDRYGVVVVRGVTSWLALVDLDGDGSLEDERAIADYLVRGETFTFSSGWAARGAGPITAALNLEEDSLGRPRLAVVLDTSGHGTHVAGVAAGHMLYGLSGLDGVAPGAWLIGLKIANNSRGGVSTNGSILRAMEYAARFAEERRLTLVMNLSFGIGNEIEGGAVIDSIVDAFLLRHPAVVFTVAAGNDGPGTSTMGLPGSAELALTIGAVYPGAFSAVQFGAASSDVMGWWSSRGGELGKPDLVAPGMAYSTVPRWNSGEEIKLGTSFAAPHVAGLAALLRSALLAEGRRAGGADIAQALRATARRFEGHSPIDQGAGLPRLEAAWRWLLAGHRAARYQVTALSRPDSAPGPMRAPARGRLSRAGASEDDQAPGRSRPPRLTAAYRRDGLAQGDTIQRFRVSRITPAPEGRETFRLVSDQPWLRPSAPTVSVDPNAGSAVVEVRYDAARLAEEPGRHVGAVYGVSESDSAAGPAFALVSTVIVPHTEAGGVLSLASRKLPGAAAARYYVRVPPGAASLAARAVLRDTAAALTLFLFEPSGRPARGGDKASAGGEEGPRTALGVSAEDLTPGVWEVVVQAMPGRDVIYDLEIAVPPLHVARADAAARAVTFASTSPRDTTLLVTAAQVGVETRYVARVERGEVQRRRMAVPAWARRMVVETELPRELWNWVTDFAVTVFDDGGSQLGNSPMNYAFQRVEVTLPERRASDFQATVELYPGLALTNSPAAIPTAVRVAFVGEPRPLPLAGGGDSAAVFIPARGAAQLVLPDLTPLAPGPEWEELVRLRATGRAEDWVSVQHLLALPRR